MGPDAPFSSVSHLSDPATAYEGSLLGLVETDTSGSNKKLGRCLVLLGVATPTEGGSEQLATAYLMSEFWARVDSEWIVPERDGCDTEAIRAGGYDRLGHMEVPMGTPYAFYAEFFIPGNTATPDLVSYGHKILGLGPEEFVYQPTILTEIPPAPA